MATAFNRTFEFIRIGQPCTSKAGDYVPGEVSRRTVRGTVQPMSGKEAETYQEASRNTGLVKIYCSERLDFRQQGGEGLGYVRCGGFIYELVQELPYQNGLIPHYKYVGCLVPVAQIPEALR